MVESTLEELKQYSAALIPICQRASEEIRDVYYRQGDIEVESKQDSSPLTEADLRANTVIVAGLKALTPNIPVLTEETQLPPYDIRKMWKRYWIVDPLDGTKEFIRRNDEFTVNIALIENNKSVLGIVYVPVTNVAYVGIIGDGAYKIVDSKTIAIQCASTVTKVDEKQCIDVVASTHHSNQATEDFIANIEAQNISVELKSKGSSLKFCLLAEGLADVYPRMAPTSEWDTAAAHAVLEAAGGMIVKIDFMPLEYNTKESILNPYFIAFADPAFPWADTIRKFAEVNTLS